jgi:hypothetical protein
MRHNFDMSMFVEFEQNEDEMMRAALDASLRDN